MPFVRTNVILSALQARLESLPLEASVGGEERLFQRVGAFGANRLMEALKSVFASEQRVCFIVPGGDNHASVRDRNLLLSTRDTKIALLIADQAFDADKTAALVGGVGALGILEMKDTVIENLVKVPFAGPDLAFAPGEGAPLVISDAEKAGANLGRECWLQWFTCYAGSARQAIP